MKNSIKLFLTAVFIAVVSFSTHAQSWSSGSGSLYVSPSTTKVGIGTSNPLSGLHLVATGWDDAMVRIERTNGYGGALRLVTKDNGAMFNNRPLGNLIWHGSTSSSTISVATARINATTTENWTSTANGTRLEFRTTQNGTSAPPANPNMIIDHDGDVGIGTTSPGQKLEVAGSVLANAFLTSSDRRFKKDIKQLEGAGAKLLSLRGVSYSMNQQSYAGKGFDSRNHIGLVAQEVHEVFPELVHEDASGFMSVDYVALIPVIIEALKEQQNVIARQEAKIQQMESTLSNEGSDNESPLVASLEQNAPNPFSNRTEIRYTLPENTVNASIFIHDINGKQLKVFPLTKTGNSSIFIDPGELEAGLYIYTLIADGNEISSKRLILSK